MGSATNVKTRSPIRRIIWAIDPFEENGRSRDRTIEALKVISAKTGAVVEPVYVFSPAELALPPEYLAALSAQYKPAATRALEKIVDGAKLGKVARPRVLSRPVRSKRQAVEALSRYARSRGAGLIVASTHSTPTQSALERIVLGSFSQALLYHSEIPALITSPHSRARAYVGSVLFPTDLSQYSRRRFEVGVSYCSVLGLSMRLFHVLSTRSERRLTPRLKAIGKLKAWADWARQRDVAVEVEVAGPASPSPRENLKKVFARPVERLGAQILRSARRRGCSLVMTTPHSGPVRAAISGSVAKDLTRASPCPVLVLR